MASNIKKPNGQYSTPTSEDALLAFLADKPTRKITGIGKVGEKILADLGMNTLGEVRANFAQVLHAFSPQHADFLLRSCMGVAENEGRARARIVLPPGATAKKSISCERTCAPVSSSALIQKCLREVCEKLAEDMAAQGLMGKGLTLKVKRHTFEVLTRASRTQNYVHKADELYTHALALLQVCSLVKAHVNF